MQALSVKPHIILNFDVNGTLILKDSIKETRDYMLICALAKNTFANWSPPLTEEEKSEPSSFKHYVDHVMVPGDRSDPALKCQRQTIIANFLTWLSESSHPLYETVLNDYHRMRSVFTNPSDGEINFTVFASFYRLIDKLREMEISFTLILRSFGNDLPDVVKEIEEHESGLKITHWGSFKQKKLTIEEESIERIDLIFDRFLTPETHFAIKDDWQTWNQDGERGRSGKPFLYSAGGTGRVKNLSLFFDDNITGDEEHDIIDLCEIRGQNIAKELLCHKLIFPVNTREAVLDTDYYIKLVMQAIKDSELIEA